MTDSNSLPPLISSLLQSTAYPHAVDAIRILETHISWVLLTGGFAYKVKKPVNLGFLDFSTLPRRRHFCEEELRLNQRFSEDLYLEVVSVQQVGSQIKVTGEDQGHTIEYAVRMRQFPQADLANEMLQAGRLSAVELNDFAMSLARFHQQARLSPIHRDDSVSSARSSALENFAHLDQIDWDENILKSLGKLQVWSISTFNNLVEAFRDRSEGGFVCDCHGDLHLGNIVWWKNRLTPFDCIEFNQQFRQIDVMSEIAFLVMDLDDHQRSDLAASFLNAYLEQTGDYAGLWVLTFYLVYRSMVRAKVVAIRLQQGHLTDSECEVLMRQCESYLDLATRYTQEKTPTLAITCGLSGSGKTTGSDFLIRQSGFVRIRSDVERKRLFGLSPLERGPNDIASGIYSQDANARTEERLLAAATDAIQAGFSVIVDATFLRLSQRRAFMELAEEEDVPFQIYYFEAEHDLLRRRIQQRQHSNTDASDATVDVLEHQIEIQEMFSEDEQPFVASGNTVSGSIQK